MYTKNELMFPHYAIPHVQDTRGESWRELVERVMRLPETHEDVLAFMLMMIRINGCMACETDSYRAMRGCTMCTLQTLRRYKGGDAELLAQYAQAQADVREYLAQTEPLVLFADLMLEPL
ncbi:MAG: hypothetical protein GYB65_06315 [Chloroflexi bacterium]|nr:hypothetical protein [Chloroflexota bacterium]